MSNLITYSKSLVNPFDTTVSHPKIHDGRVDRTSGIRLRSVGEITCHNDGTDTFIVLHAGFTSPLYFSSLTDLTNTVNSPEFPAHYDTDANRNLIHGLRVVATGLKLSLVNSPDESEGFWESIRIPYVRYHAERQGLLATTSLMKSPISALTESFADAANNPSYQTGKLRDLHRYMFKLNYRNTERSFYTNVSPVETNDRVDTNFDVIVIKVHGRVDTNIPSILHYDVVSLQEIEYKNGTMLSRLMTPSVKLNSNDQILSKANFKQPSVRLI